MCIAPHIIKLAGQGNNVFVKKFGFDGGMHNRFETFLFMG